MWSSGVTVHEGGDATSQFNTLSGRIGKVVASHAAVARSSTAEVGLIYTMHVALRGYCP